MFSQTDPDDMPSVQWVESWLKKMNSRITFLAYKGGCGGEFIMNNLQRYYFAPNREDAEFDARTNRSMAPCHIFGNFFIYRSMLEYDTNNSVIPITNFKDLAKQLVKYSHKNYIDFNSMRAALDTDRDILVRTHQPPKVLELFTNSKKISLIPGEKESWQTYCRKMTVMKIQLRPLFVRKEKLDFIDKEHHQRSNEDLDNVESWPETKGVYFKDSQYSPVDIKQVVAALGPLMETGVPVFEAVIRQLIMPENYNMSRDEPVDTAVMNTVEFQTDVVDIDPEMEYNEDVNSFGNDFTIYDMDDAMSGKMLDAFRITNVDKEKFVRQMTSWHKENIKIAAQLNYGLN